MYAMTEERSIKWAMKPNFLSKITDAVVSVSVQVLYIVELESMDIGQCQNDTVESDSTVRRVNDSLESDSITSLTQRSQQI